VAVNGYVAGAHRAVMLDSSVAPDLREAAYARASALLEESFARAPMASTAAKLAELHRDRGDAAPAGAGREDSWDEAITWYERSLELQPVAPVALTAYAQTLERMGVWDGAASLYARALSIDPARHEARAGRIRALLGGGDVLAARAEVDAGVAIDPAGLASALEHAPTPVAPLVVTQSRVLYQIAAGDIDADRSLLYILRRDAPENEVTRALLLMAGEREPLLP
jgi:tetratricopeptide (TPR) repeat protein